MTTPQDAASDAPAAIEQPAQPERLSQIDELMQFVDEAREQEQRARSQGD